MRLLRIFLLQLSLAAYATAGVKVAILPVGETAGKIAPLLEARLSIANGWELVDRSQIDAQAAERAIDLMNGADLARRREFGARLGADLVVVLRGTEKQDIQLIACDARRGLRIARATFAANENAADAAMPVLERARSRFAEKDLRLICIPGVIDRNLTRQFSHLAAAYTQLLWQTFEADDSVLPIELAESDALAREQALGTQVGVDRQLPILIRVEYANEGYQADSPQRFEWIISRGNEQLIDRKSDAIDSKSSAEWVVSQTQAIVAEITKSPAAAAQHWDAKQLNDQAQRSFRTGQYQDAYELFEASLLVDPSQTETYASAAIALTKLLRHEVGQLIADPRHLPWEQAQAKARRDQAVPIARLLSLMESYLTRQTLQLSTSTNMMFVNAKAFLPAADTQAMFLRVMKHKYDGKIQDDTPRFLTFIVQSDEDWPNKDERIAFVGEAARYWMNSRYSIGQTFNEARVDKSSPALLKALDGMLNCDNQLARRAAIQLRRLVSAGARLNTGVDSDIYPTVQPPNLKPVASEQDAAAKIKELNLHFSGVIKAGATDIFWANENGHQLLYRQKDEPQPIQLAEIVGGSIPIFDGRNIWYVQIKRDEKSQINTTALMRFDVQTGAAQEVKADLPPGPMDRAVLVSIAPEAVCLFADYGEIGGRHRRNWIGVIRTADDGVQTQVIHDVHGDDDSDDAANHSLANTFIARQGVLIQGKPDAAGKPTPLIAFRHPSGAAIVDPAKNTIRLLSLPNFGGMWGLYWTSYQGLLLWYNPVDCEGAKTGLNIYDVAQEKLIAVNTSAPPARLLVQTDGVRCIYFQRLFFAKTPLDPFEELPTYEKQTRITATTLRPRLNLFDSNHFGLIGFDNRAYAIELSCAATTQAATQPESMLQHAAVELKTLHLGIGMMNVRSGFLPLPNDTDLVWGGTDDNTWLFLFKTQDKPPRGPRILQYSKPVFDGQRVWFIQNEAKGQATSLCTLDPATEKITPLNLAGKLPADPISRASIFVLKSGSIVLNAAMGENPERSYIAFIDLGPAGQVNVEMFHEGKLQAETTGEKGDELGNDFFSRFGVIVNDPPDKSGSPAATLLMPFGKDRGYAIDLATRTGRLINMPKRAAMYADRWMANNGTLIWSDSFGGGLQRFDLASGDHQIIRADAPEGMYCAAPDGIYLFNRNQFYFTPSLDKPFTPIPLVPGGAQPGELHLFKTHHWGWVGLNYDAYQFLPQKN